MATKNVNPVADTANNPFPSCKEGCDNLNPPYCHCVDCGETGVHLDEDGCCSEVMSDTSDSNLPDTIPPPPISVRRLAVCVVIIRDDMVLAVSRRGSEDAWGLPGGKVDSNEAPVIALIREVQEETGLLLDKDNLSPCYTRIDDTFLVITYWYSGSVQDMNPVQGDAGPVSWVTWNDLFTGPFGNYNTNLFDALDLMQKVHKT